MRSNICLKLLHLVFFVLSLLSLWLNITASDPLKHQLVAATRAHNYKCIDKERDALLHFKAYILKDPYNILSTWTDDENKTNDCCKWSGVECNNQTGHVTSLAFISGHLEGKISPSLLNLSYLNHLDLYGCSFGGTIPTFIGSMTHLTYLRLSFNSFSGTIPRIIGSMTQLRYLYLGGNNFSGTIPKFIGSMTQLTHLSLSLNDFTGTVPSEFGNLTNLQELALRSLTSCTIENLDWLSHLTRLENLDMTSTSLRRVDNWVNVILSLPKLVYLRLAACDLSQVVHPYSSSTINSSAPNSYISVIDLGSNNLNSSMYHWLFPLTSNRLIYLYLSFNKLDWIPKYIGNLCSLSYLYFGRNSIAAKFPDLLNNLSGCASVTLQNLGGSYNQLTGSLSDDIQKFQSLQYIYLSHNQLNGTISEKVWQLPNLYVLQLFSNSLKSAFSGKNRNSKDGINNLSNMTDVNNTDFSSNNFSARIMNVQSSMKLLDLSENKLSGGISFLCEFFDGSLSYLDLSNNSLTGQIPDCLFSFRELQVLNLGYNKLFGRIPASVGSLINLEVLYLNNNNFYGELPLSLKTCTKLEVLYLGANGFSGDVPFWIGEKLSSLYALSLTSNNFCGTIPLQLCQLVNLQVLDLSMNNLFGNIPSCLDNITAMVKDGLLSNRLRHFYNFNESLPTEFVDHVMIQWQGNAREFTSNLRLMKIIDLSRNNLTGKIPDELIGLHKLVALNLSTNTLYGEIPQKIGEMKELQILDLSRNNLSGRIPSSMSQMNFLNYLDVSNNNLSGRIPSSTQLQSFGSSRYTGNTGLCGLPLPKHCLGDKDQEVPPVGGEREEDGENEDDLQRWFYIGGGVGFPIGFWVACSALLLIRRGRYTFFHFMNNLENLVYVKVMVFIAKIQRVAHP